MKLSNEQLESMSLEELINACGESFYSLEYVRRDGHTIPSMVGDEHDRIWKANCMETFVLGETPKEAVIKLYNKLNK